MKPKIYEVEIQRSSNHLVIRKVGKSKSVSTMLATILLLAISVGSALLFAFLVSKGLITVTSARTPSVLLVASSDKWDNITQLELRSQAGETLKTQDLGLRIEGWMENSQGGRQYVRFYIPSLSTQRQAVQAEFYQYDWGRVLYVWCLENSVGMASSLHVMMEGNGENVRFVSFTRINLVHSPSRSLIFSAGTPLTVFLRVLPPIYPGAPGTSIENLWIENTLLTTNPNPPAPLTADQLFLWLGSGSGKIYLGYGTRWSTYVATSIYDNGKLGIGITSPSARLHVRGDNVLFENASGSVGFYMDAQSRVGIGTTTPAYTLDVNGDIRTTGNIRTDGGTIYHAADSRLNIYNNTNATDSRAWIELWGYDSGGRTGELCLAGTYIDFRYNDTDTTIGPVGMRLDSSGRLGIGTTSPATKLDVAGTIRAQRLLAYYPSLLGYTFENFGGIFPAVVACSSSRPWGNDPGWKDPTAWPYPTGRALTYLPSGGRWELGLRGVDGSQAFWYFIGKPPASTLYFYVGYVDDYVDVYVKDVTTGTVTQLIDIDSYGNYQITASMSLNSSHDYIIFIYWEDTGTFETLQFQFWFGGTVYTSNL